MANIVRLTGLTEYGKRRINSHGELWDGVSGPLYAEDHLMNETYKFLGEDMILIQSVDTKWTRWIHRKGDADFKVEFI